MRVNLPTARDNRQRFQRWLVVAACLLVLVVGLMVGLTQDDHEFAWHDWLGDQNGPPIAMSHQGAQRNVARPDMQGFVAAVEVHDYLYIESDVRLIDATAPTDKEPNPQQVLVALHTLGSGIDPLDKINADWKKDWLQDFPNSALDDIPRVATVEALLDHSSLQEVRWNFELKGGDVATADALQDLVAAAEKASGTDVANRVCLSFGDIKKQSLVREIRSDFGCSCASFPEKSFFFDSEWLQGTLAPLRRSTGQPIACVQILHQLITPEDVKEAHDRGIAIHAWELTISEGAKMDRTRMIELLDMGVDGITTDDPGLLKTILQDRQEWPE